MTENYPWYSIVEGSDILRVIDFRNVYGLPYRYLKQLCGQRGPRLRLLPPYREHLSQAFARFFMRVGLPTPVNIDSK